MTLGDRVLKRMSAGEEYDSARLAIALDIDRVAAIHILNRLACQGRIREIMPGKYKKAGKDCLLSEVWK